MTKKFRKSLEALSTDGVIAKLGDYCEKARLVTTDKNAGTLKTLFNIAKTTRKEHGIILTFVAAQKLGVEGKGSDGTLAAIADAVEASGSPAAAKIRAYVDMIEACKAVVGEARNPFKYMKASVQAAKKLG